MSSVLFFLVSVFWNIFRIPSYWHGTGGRRKESMRCTILVQQYSIVHYKAKYIPSILSLLQNWCTILALPIKSKIIDRFWCSKCLNHCIDLHNVIGSLESGSTASIVAKNWTRNLSQLFKELQSSNSEFKLITPKPITKTYFDLF